MKDLLTELYYMECDSLPREPKTETDLEKDEEWQAYQKLCTILSKEERELFDKFEQLYAERYCKQIEDFYKRGFESGFFFATELYR